MDLQAQFEDAIANSKKLSQKPGNETLLKLYALYKQGTEGDIHIDPPENMFDFVAKAKYSAWEEQKGKPKDTAKQEYIDLVKSLG